MVLFAEAVDDLQKLGRAIGRFGDALRRLAVVHPPPNRTATAHPEIQRLTREFDSATAIVEKAVEAKFMTAAQYRRIARHFAAIARGMEAGAAKEAAAQKRRRT